MSEARATIFPTDLLAAKTSDKSSSHIANEARERALAAGLTITTHKDGRLVQEKSVKGRVVELFSREPREDETDFGSDAVATGRSRRSSQYRSTDAVSA
jgi:hypothetical protein